MEYLSLCKIIELTISIVNITDFHSIIISLKRSIHVFFCYLYCIFNFSKFGFNFMAQYCIIDLNLPKFINLFILI